MRAQRIATGEADLVLGCDILTTGAFDAISKMRPGRTRAIVNTHQTPIGSFAKDADWVFPLDAVQALIMESVDGNAEFIDATKLATGLMGDSIATNLFMLGFAYQKGAIPISEAALLRAIELNGVAIESNKKSFLWGRRAAVDLALVEKTALPTKTVVLHMPQSLDNVIQRRLVFLTEYQNKKYAEKYQRLVDKVKQAEDKLKLGNKLTMAVAKYAFKLMAYKDEYEVARLYTNGDFTEKLNAQFEGDFSIKFNLAPPLFSKKDSAGHLVKVEFGSWMWQAFKVLAKLKSLRGTKLDIFGYTEERQSERNMASHYQHMMLELCEHLTANNLDTAIALANLPEHIRGYGHIKEKAMHDYYNQVALLKHGVVENKNLVSAA